ELAEELVDQYKIKNGGLVLLDIETNELRAVVSRPSLNRKAPFSDSGVENKMFTQQIPGSIFKTVVAAAAIDHEPRLSSLRFDCDQNIYGKKDPNYQHGELNFVESFAKSC